jgi:hypothetical protein
VSVIRHYAAHNLIDLTSSVSASDVFNGKISSKYHYLVPMGARFYAYIRRTLPNEATQAENEFDAKLSKFLSSINTRNVSANRRQTADGFRVNPL